MAQESSSSAPQPDAQQPDSDCNIRYRTDRRSLMAQLARGLKEAELRVLLALDALDPGPPVHGVRISSRKLAELAGIARSNVVKALDSLDTRAIITIRQGTATKAAGILLNYAKTVPIERGPVVGPPRSQNETTPVLFQDHPGPVLGPPGGPTVRPPPTENKGLTGAADRVDISNDSIRLIDRLLKANPKRIEPAKIETARRWLHGYQAKLGRERDPHPPDDRIVAQFLSIADWPILERLLYDLMAERKEPGYSYAWFVSVALQRIHGVQPATLKARRAELRVVKAGHTAEPPQPQQQPLEPDNSEPATAEADPGFSENLVRAASAGVKGL